jgi:hypothetical protein
MSISRSLGRNPAFCRMVLPQGKRGRNQQRQKHWNNAALLHPYATFAGGIFEETFPSLINRATMDATVRS